MSTRITLQSVKAAKPASKRYVVWDATIKGFGLRVSPEGRKTYVVKTRVGGRQVFISLGEHGSPLTPDMARGEALQALSKARAGVKSDRSQTRGTARWVDRGGAMPGIPC